MTQAGIAATEAAEGASQDEALEAGNYEVIRARLMEQGRELSRRAEALNQKRKHTFGGTELQVIGNPRIRTENNCVPRDIVQVGGLLLFGYEVLKLTTEGGWYVPNGLMVLAPSAFIVIGLLILIVPSAMLSETLVGGGADFVQRLGDDRIQIPPPPDSVVPQNRAP